MEKGYKKLSNKCYICKEYYKSIVTKLILSPYTLCPQQFYYQYEYSIF